MVPDAMTSLNEEKQHFTEIKHIYSTFIIKNNWIEVSNYFLLDQTSVEAFAKTKCFLEDYKLPFYDYYML